MPAFGATASFRSEPGLNSPSGLAVRRHSIPWHLRLARSAVAISNRCLLAPPSSNDDSMAAACAFLATQVAPGSLEHFDVLRGASNPSVAFGTPFMRAFKRPRRF